MPPAPEASTESRLVVVACDGGDPEVAAQLARDLGARSLPGLPTGAGDAELALCLTADRLELRELGRRSGPVAADFLSADFVRRRRLAGRRSESLARAVGLGKGPPPHVLDATAGLGRDSVLLASLGCRVTAVERHPVVAALLRDGLRRASAAPAPMPEVVGRIRLVAGEAREVLERSEPPPDVVLLDPMFPQQRRRALARRELQALQRLVGDDPDAPGLLERSLQVARRRVVVKRPAHAPPLAGPRPDLQWRGASTRLDVYLRTRD